MWRHALALSLAGATAVAAAQVPEPRVQRQVLEDDRVRIEELRVRGQVEQIVVQPKIPGVRPYEILPPDPARDTTPARRGAGQRVWRVLSF